MLKKVLTLVLAVAFLLSAMAVFPFDEGSDDEKRPSRKPHPAVKPVYFDFATFNGQTPGKTETFHVDRGPWRLHWEVEGLPNAASAGFTVFSENAALPPILEENGLAPPASGTITINKAGAFYIVVSSFDADWRLTVQKRDNPRP